MPKMRTLFCVALLFVAAYGAYKLLPVYLSAYQFDDAIKEEAKFGSGSTKTDEQIHSIIMKRAAEFDIPVQPDQVKVRRNGSDLIISADYRVTVDVPSYPIVLNFHPSSSGLRFGGI